MRKDSPAGQQFSTYDECFNGDDDKILWYKLHDI